MSSYTNKTDSTSSKTSFLFFSRISIYLYSTCMSIKQTMAKTINCLLNGRHHLRRLVVSSEISFSSNCSSSLETIAGNQTFIGWNKSRRSVRLALAELCRRDMERNDAVKLINDAAIDRRRLSSRRAAKNSNRSNDFPLARPRDVCGQKFARNHRHLVKRCITSLTPRTGKAVFYK